LSASVISPNIIKIGRYNCTKNANESKIPYSAMVKKTKKWPGIHTRMPINGKS